MPAVACSPAHPDSLKLSPSRSTTTLDPCCDAGSASHVGITTQKGDAIVLVGPAAFRTDAPLCLDADAGIAGALTMAQHVDAGGAEAYNTAFVREATTLVEASRAGGAAVLTLERALGLSGDTRVRSKCMGRADDKLCASRPADRPRHPQSSVPILNAFAFAGCWRCCWRLRGWCTSRSCGPWGACWTRLHAGTD